jgi:hypothetical protein
MTAMGKTGEAGPAAAQDLRTVMRGAVVPRPRWIFSIIKRLRSVANNLPQRWQLDRSGKFLHRHASHRQR